MLRPVRPPTSGYVRSAASKALLALVAGTMAFTAAACGSDEDDSGGEQVVAVPDDAATITEALEKVAEGGLVLIEPGTYDETVTVDVDDVTVRGLDRNEVVIDGEGQRTDGIRVVAGGVRIQNLTVIDHVSTGVLVTGAFGDGGQDADGGTSYEPADADDLPLLQRFEVSNVTASNNGLYGIYAFHSQQGVIRDSYASGSPDSGIYVGQCTECDVIVTNNVAERNAVGFENANASGVTIVGNRFTKNRVGLTLTSDYQEAFVPQRDNVVAGNLIAANDEPASPEQADGGFGIGIGLAGAQDNAVVRNRIAANPRGAVVVSNAEDVPSTGNRLVGNALEGNGVEVVDASAGHTPVADNCRTDEHASGPLADDLGAADCSASNAEFADATSQPQVNVPGGVPFFEVERGPDQPQLADASAEEPPAPLAERPEQPDVTEVGVPPADLLADLASAGP